MPEERFLMCADLARPHLFAGGRIFFFQFYVKNLPALPSHPYLVKLFVQVEFKCGFIKMLVFCKVGFLFLASLHKNVINHQQKHDLLIWLSTSFENFSTNNCLTWWFASYTSCFMLWFHSSSPHQEEEDAQRGQPQQQTRHRQPWSYLCFGRLFWDQNTGNTTPSITTGEIIVSAMLNKTVGKIALTTQRWRVPILGGSKSRVLWHLSVGRTVFF